MESGKEVGEGSECEGSFPVILPEGGGEQTTTYNETACLATGGCRTVCRVCESRLDIDARL